MNSLMTRLLVASCLGALPLAYACGDDDVDGSKNLDGGAEHSGDHDHTGDHGDTADGAVDPYLDDEVACQADYPSYSDGMSVKAGAWTVKITSANPKPPRQKVRNDWTLELTDDKGAPATGFMLSNPDSYMPVHRHHGKHPPTALILGEPGKAQLTNIDFIMRGPWQVLVDVLKDGTKVGTATVQVCVE